MWHALFWAGVAFGGVMVFVMRGSTASVNLGEVSRREVMIASVVSILFGAWGFSKAYVKGKTPKLREFYAKEDLEWAETVFSAVLLAAFLMYFVVQAFKIPSGSMRLTLQEGDHLFVNKFIYGTRIPMTEKRLVRLKDVQRGDIIVFQFPSLVRDELHCGSSQYGKDFIKRVVGVAGDKVELKDGMLFVNDKRVQDEENYIQYLDSRRQPGPETPLDVKEYQRLWESRLLDRKLGDALRDAFGPIRVPEKSYFLMGDNRDRSCDSRFWGPVPERFVKGKAWFIYWPIGRMKGVR